MFMIIFWVARTGLSFGNHLDFWLCQMTDMFSKWQYCVCILYAVVIFDSSWGIACAWYVSFRFQHVRQVNCVRHDPCQYSPQALIWNDGIKTSAMVMTRVLLLLSRRPSLFSLSLGFAISHMGVMASEPVCVFNTIVGLMTILEIVSFCISHRRTNFVDTGSSGEAGWCSSCSELALHLVA